MRQRSRERHRKYQGCLIGKIVGDGLRVHTGRKNRVTIKNLLDEYRMDI